MSQVKTSIVEAFKPCIVDYKRGEFYINSNRFRIIPYFKNTRVKQALLDSKGRWLSGLIGEYGGSLQGDIFKRRPKTFFTIRWEANDKLNVTELKQALEAQGLLTPVDEYMGLVGAYSPSKTENTAREDLN